MRERSTLASARVLALQCCSLNKRSFTFQIKWWITLNEPKQVRKGYGSLDYAPAWDDHGISDYIAVHNLLRAHGKAYKIYNDTYRATQQGKALHILLG